MEGGFCNAGRLAYKNGFNFVPTQKGFAELFFFLINLLAFWDSVNLVKLLSNVTVWPEKNRQMSIKVAQK